MSGKIFHELFEVGFSRNLFLEKGKTEQQIFYLFFFFRWIVVGKFIWQNNYLWKKLWNDLYWPQFLHHKNLVFLQGCIYFCKLPYISHDVEWIYVNLLSCPLFPILFSRIQTLCNILKIASQEQHLQFWIQFNITFSSPPLLLWNNNNTKHSNFCLYLFFLSNLSQPKKKKKKL